MKFCQFAVVNKPYLVVKRGAVKNAVRNLNGQSGRIVQWKLNGSVMADFDGELIELPRGTYKIRLK